MGCTVHDGNRLAPVALAGEHPIAQPVADSRFPISALIEPTGNRRLCLGRVQTVEKFRIDGDAITCEGRAGLGSRSCGRLHHRPARQAEFCGKLAIALIMRWHRHDRAGAVPDKHVVGDPDWDFFTVSWIERMPAGEDTGFPVFSLARSVRSRSLLCRAAET